MLRISDSRSYDIVYTCRLRLSCNKVGKSSKSVHKEILAIFHKKRNVSSFDLANSKIFIVSISVKRCRMRTRPHVWETRHHIAGTLSGQDTPSLHCWLCGPDANDRKNAVFQPCRGSSGAQPYPPRKSGLVFYLRYVRLLSGTNISIRQ